MTIAAIVVMGVSGSGKSTVGGCLARDLGWMFEDGDAFHPAANVAKMSAGTPLTDDDRWPWLRAIAARIDVARGTVAPVVIGCSALKRAYRDVLRDGHGDVRFLHLAGSMDLITARQAARVGHFMPASLVASQFATLEPTTGEPDIVEIGVEHDPATIAREAIATFRQRGDIA
ncbi:gluconokinase [Roseomonas terrae]|jgi:gluconokinase|uniref:Gluconokinase n=1 Tax=Neoroseomonas terrae TaxID=424799 RepID=A0ABS5EHU2_9PROT|nr:gluconokinase [Neoroseomonas terrae]MBR0650589.1 gluconokinase [Neoroseomonas terrae]